MQWAEKRRFKEDEAMDKKLNKLKKDSMKKKGKQEDNKKLVKKKNKYDDDAMSLPTYQLEEKVNSKEEDNNVEWQLDILIEVVNHYITKLFIVVTNEILLIGDNKEKV
jgi:hydroxymethylpyrimidine pyrophosphatase-like HAD family hydrolase